MRDARERLLDIRQAIERIELHATRGREVFDKDELIQIWIVHHLQIIGEAARALPDDILAKAPEIPWKGIVGMRHILVHSYFQIDRDIVWKVVEADMGPLKAAVNRLLT